ncbi:hypothetical protein RND71_012521 [Anisodus tanguticus]|uniref:BED-type domain-containing protein n=1 Tax=Anisodus tanguticus TaxID=243964 RepID=A0AAE1SDF6_9SOLA|nr:hypothetical protein RND71_012521 [Anisodus tanguticus]
MQSSSKTCWVTRICRKRKLQETLKMEAAALFEVLEAVHRASLCALDAEIFYSIQLEQHLFVVRFVMRSQQYHLRHIIKMEGIRGMFKGKGKTSSSRGDNQGNGTYSSHLIPTQDDFVDTQHFPTIPLDLDEELFSGTQEDFNLDDDLDDTPTNVDHNTPTSAPSTEIPLIPPSMRRGPAKRPLKLDAWTFFDRDVENQVAICKICKNVLKFKTGKGHGGTGGLIRHVVSAHPARYTQYQASKPGAQTPAPSGQGSHTDTIPDQVQGQINPMTGGIVGSKCNKHRDREAISKLVVVEENASNLPASIPSSSSSTQPHKRHVVSAASIESLRNRMCGRTSTNQISELDIFILQGSVPYQEVINEDGHEDLFEILWRGNEKTFPTLSLMARDVLNIQASSIASESVFYARADIK